MLYAFEHSCLKNVSSKDLLSYGTDTPTMDKIRLGLNLHLDVVPKQMQIKPKADFTLRYT